MIDYFYKDSLNEQLVNKNYMYAHFIDPESKFQTKKNLSDFPYMEFSHIIANCQNNDTLISAIECLKTAISFDSDLVESKITEDAIVSLEQFMKDENINLSKSAIDIIGWFNKFSKDLCERFCSSGLAIALLKHLPQFYAVTTIKRSMSNCQYEFALKFLFLLCKTVRETEDELIVNSFFSAIIIFVKRFGFDSMPDIISDAEIDLENKYECKKIIFQLLVYHMLHSVRFKLVLRMVEFCSLIPDYYPPNIIPKLLEYLADNSFFEDEQTLVESISSLIIQSHKRCSIYMKRDLLRYLYKSIIDDIIDFKISFSYTKLIVEFHQTALDDFDINIVELCTRYICCSDNLFSTKCIEKINEIIDQFSIHGKLEEMASCIYILNEAREDLESRIEDPELNSNIEVNIQSILDKCAQIFQESEGGEN